MYALFLNKLNWNWILSYIMTHLFVPFKMSNCIPAYNGLYIMAYNGLYIMAPFSGVFVQLSLQKSHKCHASDTQGHIHKFYFILFT